MKNTDNRDLHLHNSLSHLREFRACLERADERCLHIVLEVVELRVRQLIKEVRNEAG